MYVIVDTNAAIVANGKSPQASPECVINCVRRLRQIQQNEIIVLDERDRPKKRNRVSLVILSVNCGVQTRNPVSDPKHIRCQNEISCLCDMI